MLGNIIKICIADGGYNVYAISIQNDGKIIIGGSFTSYNGISRNRIARLNSDGTLDTTFNPGTGASSFIYTTKIQSNGKIIIGGSFTTYNGIQRKYIARLNTDGSLDTAFNSGTLVNSQVYCTSIQNDGKIYIGGFSYLTRLYSDGTLDLSFTPNLGSNVGTFRFILIQNDGKIISAGNYAKRFNSDGTLDNTFSIFSNASGYSSANFQNDGKIIVTSFTNIENKNCVARLNGGTLSTPVFEKDNIVVYPNPAKDHITVDCGNLDYVSGWHITITNVLGQEIYNHPMNTQQHTVALNSWTGQGMYFVKVYDAQNHVLTTKKIILQ